MYEPVRVPPGRPSRRRIWVTVVLIVTALAAIAVTVARTMPHRPPTEALTLDELAMIVPDAAETAAMAAIVRARIATKAAAVRPSATAKPAPCVAPKPPHTWNSTQRENATTIVQVGLALGISEHGLVIALATAMQESQLYNLGHLGVNNDHDSLGLFQQRPSMGWGSKAQVTDPVYSATAFFLALQRVRGWTSMRVTVAAQSVQRSAYPNAYAKWETDARALVQLIVCREAAGSSAPAP